MNTLAHEGGGPWFLFIPIFWAAVIFTFFAVRRRIGWQRHRGPDEQSPLSLLGHRFAAGEIDEDEYWRRLSVLDEQFGRDATRGRKR